jgi:hypothetical protein
VLVTGLKPDMNKDINGTPLVQMTARAPLYRTTNLKNVKVGGNP